MPGYTLVPEQRGIGMVFQDFALFPHLSVARNIEFGTAHLPLRQRRSRVDELLQLVAYLTPLWHAVSLARGIALEMLDPVVALINVAYLCAMLVVGLLWSYRTFSRKLAE